MLQQLIKSYRESQNLTLRQLAKQMGIGYVSLHRLEKGRPLNMDAVQAIMAWMWRGNTNPRHK